MIKTQIVLVLWDRIWDKGTRGKITYWDNIEDAHKYVESIESSLSREVFNGQVHWMDGQTELASARIEFVED